MIPAHQQPFLRWLQRLGLAFWLPLPLLGACFWVGGGLLTSQVLSRPYGTENALQADVQLEVSLSVSVSLIRAVVNQDEASTLVEVKTVDSALKQLEFEFPVTELSQVEAAIAQELGLSIEEVRRLVRYEIVE
ncbi:MAG: hypothetical protein HC840_21270 [Leptolyngbyaceae cyanobacterium RM2_2_4]|nr:hypothetical protein [Leptolyngbyaceae cyanobacterium SL_5_14]NJO51539.1 hypothetical protein [Leptolyngbyaceae cyanobacterium RM2_2_4]